MVRRFHRTQHPFDAYRVGRAQSRTQQQQHQNTDFVTRGHLVAIQGQAKEDGAQNQGDARQNRNRFEIRAQIGDFEFERRRGQNKTNHPID